LPRRADAACAAPSANGANTLSGRDPGLLAKLDGAAGGKARTDNHDVIIVSIVDPLAGRARAAEAKQ